MIKFKRLTIALLALLSISTTAWADGVTASEIDATVSAGWGSDESLIKASDLPGYNKITLEQAMTWASAPASGTVYLIYEIVADGKFKIAKFEDGNYTDSFGWSEETHYLIWEDINYSGKRYFYTTGPEVTIDNTLEQPEATFTMPDYDVTATYTLKRDMTVEMSVSVQDAQNNSRFRVQKQGNSFVPVGLTNEQVIALFTVHDGIESKDLTAATDYTVQIYAIDAEGQPTGQPMTFATFTFEPGIYAVKAVAAQGSDYAGETDLSNTFQLFQGYQVEVAAKEFITYYKDEPLYADTETSADAVLYTIQSVNADQATLSAAIETAPSLTPLLIFNNSDEAKTFLLIPANEEPNLALTVAPEFVGTLTGTTIAASTEGQTNYALNGKAFVFVKNAIEVGANKAWLSVNNSNARAINLVFDSEATGIKTTDCTDYTDSVWYDLNGRKVNAPNKKGIYIMNGKKVVVK